MSNPKNIIMARLSGNFVLMDMIYDRDEYRGGFKTLKKFDKKHWENGMYLVNELLEPMIEQAGFCSIGSGFCPSSKHSPHSWSNAQGAAVDAWFMESGKAPIDTIKDVVRSNAEFDRAISYAGSGLLCLSNRKMGNRYKVYNNVLDRNERVSKTSRKPRFVNYQHGNRNLDTLVKEKPVEAWLRHKNEGIFHTQRQLRVGNVRVSKYYTMLDCFHSYKAILKGINNVDESLEFTTDEINTVTQWTSRLMTQALDVIADYTGCRPSIIRGLNRLDETRFRWNSHIQKPMLEFVLPTAKDLSDLTIDGFQIEKTRSLKESNIFTLCANRPDVYDYEVYDYAGYAD